MTPDERRALADAAETAALAVPGVAVVYRSGSLLADALAQGIAAVTGTRSPAPAVRVDEEAGRTRLTLSIGVAAGAPAADACRAAHDAVSRVAGDALIRITVSHVAE